MNYPQFRLCVPLSEFSVESRFARGVDVFESLFGHVKIESAVPAGFNGT